MLFINGVSQKDVEDRSLWAVELEDDFGRHWHTVTGEKLNAFCDAHDGDISDVDWVCFEDQPEELKPFFDWYEEQDKKDVPYLISEIFGKYGKEL